MKNYKIVPNIHGRYSIYERQLFFLWVCIDYDTHLENALKIVEHLNKKVIHA